MKPQASIMSSVLFIDEPDDGDPVNASNFDAWGRLETDAGDPLKVYVKVFNEAIDDGTDERLRNPWSDGSEPDVATLDSMGRWDATGLSGTPGEDNKLTLAVWGLYVQGTCFERKHNVVIDNSSGPPGGPPTGGGDPPPGGGDPPGGGETPPIDPAF